METLIERYKPTILIVQLGTNWTDRSLSDDQIRALLGRFVSVAHPGGTRRIIWLGPPESWRGSKVQNPIHRPIQQPVRPGDPVADPRRVTNSGLGKPGRDGGH